MQIILVIWKFGCLIQAAEFIRVRGIQGKYNQAYLGNNIILITKRRCKLLNEIIWNDGYMILNWSIGFLG